MLSHVHAKSTTNSRHRREYIFQGTDYRVIAPVCLECLRPLCGSYSQTAAGEVRFKLCDYVLAHDTAVYGTDLRQTQKKQNTEKLKECSLQRFSDIIKVTN